MPVPTSLLGDLRQTPADRPVTLLMRHSVRFPIYDFATGDAIGLTPEGFLLAEQFGTVLATLRRPGRLLSSPVGRCVDTARSILKGAGWTDTLEIDPLLGHP
ncbi:MAG TPA: histidine phosphatase family protein, partial [Anaerolineaceae bacterium]|nr:histidine phosphatase family protein [Anaerolineaceae bacterium]